MKHLPKLILSLFFLLSFSTLKAQNYPWAAGLRFSYESGVSVKYFYAENKALEGIFGFRKGGAVFTGLWEQHMTAFQVEQLKFYYGFGGHIGGGGDRYKRVIGDTYERRKGGMLLGADGVIGLEYKFDEAPIAISLDLNPRMEMVYGTFFDIAPG
ncbi:MAG: hypothetical protein INR69_19475, partial [Mucilaginibacter polytrichastri]|nr:hypothetical protein [Mucilaginibacter polytrichastri]